MGERVNNLLDSNGNSLTSLPDFGCYPLLRIKPQTVKRRDPKRILMASSLGPYVNNEWTAWVDKTLLTSDKIHQFIKPSNYSFWLGKYSDWIKTLIDTNIDPLLLHAPEIKRVSGVTPLWAMSFGEKNMRSSLEGLPWSPRFSVKRSPSQLPEALSYVGLGSTQLTHPSRIERECFRALDSSLTDKLRPTIIERIYTSESDKMILLTVLNFDEDRGKWLLRCGNQLCSSNDWKTDYLLEIPELDKDLYLYDNFTKSTRRLLRLNRPLAVEINDNIAVIRNGYSTQKLD